MDRNNHHSLVKRIAFIGNYLPRQCGIATFTTDLCEAVATGSVNSMLEWLDEQSKTSEAMNVVAAPKP